MNGVQEMSEPPTARSAQYLDRQAVGAIQAANKSSQPRELLRILVLIAALGITALGLLAGSIGLLLSLLRQDTGSLAVATLSISLIVLTVGLGLLLAWHTGSAIQRRPSPAFRPRKIGSLVLLFLLSLVIGQMILSQSLLPSLTFPPFHVTATILPALVILALVGRGLGPITSRRDIVLQLTSGAFLGAPLAFTLEALALLSLLAATFIGLAAHPGGPELIRFWSTYLQDPTQLQDPDLLAPLLNSPAIIAAAVVFVAGIVPLIEEGIKTVGVALMSYRKPTVSQSFLWGLAGGAGFAIAEGLLNTAGGLEAWALRVLVRVGATLLHCSTGALMGITWHNTLVKRRWGRAFGLYAACVAVHGLWNALSIGQILLSLGQTGSDLGASSQVMTGLGIAVPPVLLGTLGLVMALSLLWLTRYLRKQSSPPQTSENRQPLPASETPSAPDPTAGTGQAER
jgi:hypothetical protein